MQKEISKVGKHHQLPLPLRNDNMSLPNSGSMVEKTLTHLKNGSRKIANSMKTTTNSWKK